MFSDSSFPSGSLVVTANLTYTGKTSPDPVNSSPIVLT